MKYLELKKKIILITGSNKGIGRQLLENFSINEAEIISCSRKKTKEHEFFCNELSKKYNTNIYTYYFDLENLDEISKNLNEILNKFQKIDILINNAGVNFTSLIEMTSIEQLKKIFDINFFSIYFITQKLLRLLKKANSPRIINISSTASLENNIGRFAYSSSKSLVNSYTKSLSKEVARYNIRVNAIAPGLTDTEMMTKTTTEKNIEQTLKRVPLGRIAKKQEIADLVLFLSSESSSYINGQVIRIDGGLNEGI